MFIKNLETLPFHYILYDETGLSTVHYLLNVLCQKGLQQVEQVTSGNRDILITVYCILM